MSRPGKESQNTDRDAYSIEQFCQRHSISVAMYYKMRADDPNSVPREFRAGKRVLISKEAAAAWRKAREREHANNQRRSKT
jgi:hypothetical protein